jgi:hypothetical protein
VFANAKQRQSVAVDISVRGICTKPREGIVTKQLQTRREDFGVDEQLNIRNSVVGLSNCPCAIMTWIVFGTLKTTKETAP